jgi:hypothetical protein
MQVDVPDHVIGRGGVLISWPDRPATAFYMTDPDHDSTFDVYRVDLDDERQNWSYLGRHTLSVPLRSYSWPATRRAGAGVTPKEQRLAWTIEAFEALGVPQPLACHVLLARAKAGLP